MKELSVEDKAKRYDEAIEKLCSLHDDYDTVSTLINIKEELENIFLELKESEDEKIMKELIDYFSASHATDTFRGIPWDRVVAWLEAQSTKVSAIEGFETEFERQVSGLIASAINKEHEYNQGYVKWTANALLNYAKHELEKQGEQNDKIIKGKNYFCVKTHNYAGVEWIKGTKYYASDNYTLVNQGCEYYCPEYSKEEHNYLFKEVKCDGCVEKQGEQKPADNSLPKYNKGDILTDGKSTYKVLSWDYTEKGIAAYYIEGNGCKFSWFCNEADKKLKPVEQKPADKVEPRYKVGDWVVPPNGVYWHIDAINNNRYEVSSTDGVCANWPLDTDLYHLWNIQDAKDGDMLVASDNKKCPFIYRTKTVFGNPVAYCGVRSDGVFISESPTDHQWCLKSEVIPATKEQHELLFQKMKEAGYEWDAEKKELRKVKKAPQKFMVGDTIKYNGTEYKITEITPNGYKVYALTYDEDAASFISFSAPAILIEQNPAWSEEDEDNLNSAIYYIRREPYLESNVEPIVDWLKFLKERYTWKPSDEQMKALSIAMCGVDDPLFSLYQDLLKLREE